MSPSDQEFSGDGSRPDQPSEPTPDFFLPALKGAEASRAALKVRLKEVPFEWTSDGLTVSGNFFYPTFKAGLPTVEDFVTLVYWNIVPYCLPRKVRQEKDKKYEETGDFRYVAELRDQAVRLFSKAKATIQKAGEPGEVVLFMLTEAILEAPQIACKMYLKTNSEMPVHGTDGVHIAFDRDSDTLKLIWGESKLYSQLSSALDQICESFSSFIAIESGVSAKDRDIDIIKDHADIVDPLQKEKLLKYFDPYEDESNQFSESLCCFVGFDYSVYEDLMGSPPAEREGRFEIEFKKRIQSACALFAEKIAGSSFSTFPVHFFLIPLPDVKHFRKSFFEKLGANIAD